MLAGNGRFKRGLGCGAAIWGGGGRGDYGARVTIFRDGGVLVEHGVQDIGTGTRTYVGMIVAEELGIPPSKVRVEIGSTKYPSGAASGGSVTTASAAPPVKRAAEAAKAALFAAAAPRMNVKPEELEAEDGKVFVKSDPATSVPFEQACSALGPAGVTGDGKYQMPNDPLQRAGVAGVQFAEAEVDTETGHVKVIKMVALQDGGIILNPLTFTSQVNGGVIQGIGMALLEDRRMCQLTGRMVNPNMEWYKVPGTMDMPEFVSVPFENPDAQWVTGIGEPPVIPTAGAIRNAILNATGAYLYHAPMTPGDVLEALAAARRRA
jgi:xanthine dehydrogenase YagR molybdenum-binding subunit